MNQADRKDGLVLAWVRLAALSGVAVAQPLFDILGRTPTFFVNNGAEATEIIVFAIVALLGPPTVLVAGQAAVTLVFGRAMGRRAHLVAVALLVCLLFAPIADRLPWRSAPVTLALVLGIGSGAALLYARATAFRRLVTIAAIGLPVLAGVFLFASPVAPLVRGGTVTIHGSTLRLDRKPPIVLLVFDEFPLASLVDVDAEIDETRFPHFAALAQKATWYRNATTVSDSTAQAVPAMLTGKRVRPYAANVPSVHPRSLFTLLGGEYEFRGLLPRSCPDEVCPKFAGTRRREGAPSFLGRERAMARQASIVLGYLALPQRLEHRLPAVEALGLGLTRPAVPALTDASEAPSTIDEDPRLPRWDGAIDVIRPAGATVDYVYELLPHRPWTILPSKQTHSPVIWRVPGLSPEFVWSADPRPVAASYRRHLAQVAAADALIGELVRKLEDNGMYDDAMIVVTADHGITFLPGENSRLEPNERTLPEIAQVPLFVKYPGQADGGPVDINAQGVDILPTVIDVLDVDVDWDLEGRSLLAAGQRPGKVLIDSTGKTHRLADDLVAQLRSVARRKYEFTGLAVEANNEAETFFAHGRHSDLVGRRVAGLPSRSGTGVTWQQRWGPVGANIDTGGGVLPAVLTASAAEPSIAEGDVAIAVDGRIAAVTQAFSNEGETWIDSLLLPSLLREGRNDIAVYLVEGHVGEVTLRPMGLRGTGRG